MNEKQKPQTQTVGEKVEGLEPVDPAALEPFMKAMDEAIPKIVDAEERRLALAANSRQRQLKC